MAGYRRLTAWSLNGLYVMEFNQSINQSINLKAVLDFYREAPALSLHDVKREFVKNMAETDCTTAAEYLALVEATASRANHMEVNTYSDADVASQVVNGLSPHFSPIMMELYKNRQERDLAAVRAAIRTIGPMLNKQLQQQHGGQPGASAVGTGGLCECVCYKTVWGRPLLRLSAPKVAAVL